MALYNCNAYLGKVSEMAPLLDEYIEYCEQHIKRYGAKTAVFLQCGDFFELYQVPGEAHCASYKGADIHVVGDICNLQVTRKNKSVVDASYSNPYMAGFPMHALAKHSQCLLSQGYTIVIVRQVSPPPLVRREVTEILSPSTILNPTSPENSYLVCYFCDSDSEAAVGVAGVDISTGHTFIYEASEYIHDEIHRVANMHRAVETVVYGPYGGSGPSGPAGLSGLVHMRGTEYDPKYLKPRIQNELLKKAYPAANGLLEPIETLGIERLDVGRTAFVLLLEFAYSHNDHIIQWLKPPEIIEKRGRLNIEYNSALQLDLISASPSPNATGLIGILNRCATAFGKRLFRERIMNPITDTVRLEERYNAIESFRKGRAYIPIHRTLSKVMDIERMARRICLGKFSPMDWVSFNSSLDAAREAAEIAGAAGAERIMKIQEAYKGMLNLDECAKYILSDIKSSIFATGVCKDIDAIAEEIAKGMQILAELAENTVLCKVDSNDRDGYFLSCTKKRWDTIKADYPNVQAKPISPASSTLRLTSNVIDAASEQILAGQKKMVAISTERYRDFLTYFYAEHCDGLNETIAFLADLDVTVTNAKNADDFNYNRPALSASSACSGSRAEFKGLRHPIIERLQDRTDYIPNDVSLSQNGILLYGINAVGKSSLMKAIGLNIIMAQSGMYVSAAGLELHPYTSIFTRISGSDNLFSGMSTFTVEMTELKTILQRCTADSLVLGDELCAGTESISALAIVAAGVETLLKKGVAFVFATHLHDLLDIPRVQGLLENPEYKLDVFHMHIERHPETGKLMYDRRLREGRGSALYGLEVALSLGMPDEFLRVAQKVRRHLLGIDETLIPGKASRYNQRVLVDKCGVCKTNKATETHHIRYQQHANEGGWVDNGVHKNRPSNLVPLCETCHLAEHKGHLKIKGYKMTTDGPELVWV